MTIDELESLIAEGWWKGRFSTCGLSLESANGPMLQARCAADVKTVIDLWSKVEKIRVEAKTARIVAETLPATDTRGVPLPYYEAADDYVDSWSRVAKIRAEAKKG